ncbi:MAG: coniferyl aldehyde dehydrogenase [Novosphingobium sp.]
MEIDMTIPLPRTSPDRLAALLSRQRNAFLAASIPTLKERRADLKKLRSAILARRAGIEAALNADFGHRSRHETAMMDIMTPVEGINNLLRNLRRFMRSERRRVAMTFRFASARVEYQPLGVIGIVSPWNYPLALALMPLATALAAGNRAMIKPSEFTPQTSSLLAGMLGEIFLEDRVAVVTGDASVGAAFTSLPFDHLLFTGSTQVGRAVMRAASDNLVPVTLELGGKSPVVVARGKADDRTAAAIAFGKLANAGQTCVAPDYAFVHEDDVGAFAAAYGRAVSNLYPEGPTSPDFTSIIDTRQFDRLNAHLSDAAGKGAQVLPIGVSPDKAGERSHTIPPLLVLQANETMTIMRDEIFGPILPVLTYRDLDEAIAYINAGPRPLALYYFGADDADRHQVLTRTTSGNVGINNTLMHYAQDDIPFGGVGASGMGAYHGIEGFRSMSHAKGIYVQGRWNAATMLRAPFGRLADAILGVVLR